MKAVVIASHGHVELQEIEPPAITSYEALVKIKACGICGTTDRHIIEGHMPHHPADQYPAVLGHEAVGTIIQIGDQVRKFKIGDRVTRPTSIWPGTHRNNMYSAWGGFAEYGIVRDTTAEGAPPADYTSTRQHIVPRELSLEDAVIAISLSEVASWSQKLGNLEGRNIVIGGTGFAASVMCQCAHAGGAKNIITFGRNPKKFDQMKRNGATHTLPFDEQTRHAVLEINGGVGADWFLDAAGKQPVFEGGLSCLRAGGKCAIYGAPDGFAYRLPLGGASYADFSVHYLTPSDDTFFQETCGLILNGKLNPSLIRSHTWHGLESIHQALKEQFNGEVLKGMVIF